MIKVIQHRHQTVSCLPQWRHEAINVGYSHVHIHLQYENVDGGKGKWLVILDHQTQQFLIYCKRVFFNAMPPTSIN